LHCFLGSLGRWASKEYRRPSHVYSRYAPCVLYVRWFKSINEWLLSSPAERPPLGSSGSPRVLVGLSQDKRYERDNSLSSCIRAVVASGPRCRLTPSTWPESTLVWTVLPVKVYVSWVYIRASEVSSCLQCHGQRSLAQYARNGKS